MIEEKIFTKNQAGEKLTGLRARPDLAKDKYPTVVLVHGFGGTKEEEGYFDKLSVVLSSAGFLVYRFDFSGCGESEGEFVETSLSKMVSELSNIIDFVKNQSWVDDTEIGILAHSLGTAVVLASKFKPKCFVMTGAPSNPKKSLIKIFGSGYNPEGVSSQHKSNGSVTKVDSKFWLDFDNYKLLELIGDIKTPILFIHGSEDEKVSVESMKSYYRNANEPKKKVIIEGADHGLRPHRNKAYELAADWFKRYL